MTSFRLKTQRILSKIQLWRKSRSRWSFAKFLGLVVLTLLWIVAQPAIARDGNSSAQSGEPVSLLQEGTQRYQAGQFSEAAAIWQQAAQEYERQGDIFKIVQALNYLSVAYQDLGQWAEAQAAISKSLDYLQAQKDLESQEIALFAQTLNNQGSLQLARGETETALETWKQAEELYDRAGNETGKLGSQLNQAQALQVLGHYRRAQSQLEQINAQLQEQPDSLLKAQGLRSLGRTLQTVGDLVQAKTALEQSWRISEQLGATGDTGATLFSIGNIARDLRRNGVALSYYQEAAKKAQTAIARLEAQLNQLSLTLDRCQGKAPSCSANQRPLLLEIKEQLIPLQPSRSSIYAKVNLAESMMVLGENPQDIAQWLATAVKQAKQLRDPRSEAYALTQLGKLYRQTEQYTEAKNLTQQATQIAQTINADDIVARSAWQMGQLLRQAKATKSAIASYQTSINALKSLRSDLVTVNRDIQFDFKESVEPIYREFVSLLLQPGATQEDIQTAREAIEALQIAELDNFFQEACLTAHSVQIDRIDAQGAVVYPIILRDRLEVILSIPQQPLRHYTTQLPQEELERTFQKLYSSFYLGYSGDERLQIAQQVYDWLIRPAETELAQSNIKTLVFVLDGFLQNLPMGALYDGKQYLIEKYSIALSPGLQIFPKGLDTNKPKALTAGLTEARQGFPALPGVQSEVNQISAEVEAKVLLDREFTRSAFQDLVKAKDFKIVHLATHGQFSSDPEQTFLLTWDDRINVKDFDRLLRANQQGDRAIDLLVLSACQTASGDRRAALGLAGFALRSGARSTLATLWSVSDRSTAELMAEFYQQLSKTGRNLTKAEALRQAQLKLLKIPAYSHPYFWAPFVLVGNWL